MEAAAASSSAPASASGAPASGATATLTIDNRDLLRVVHQFLAEQGLTRTCECLRAETGLDANDTVNGAALLDAVHAGRWDAVLSEVSRMSLPGEVVMSIYEQVVRECAEKRDFATALSILTRTAACALLRSSHPSRYAAYESMCSRRVWLQGEAYEDGSSRDVARARIAALLQESVLAVPPSRLLMLVTQGLKWQAAGGVIPTSSGRFDLMRGVPPARVDAEDRVMSAPHVCITLGSSTRACSVAFTHDGASLVVGSSDGLIEVYEAATGRLRADLPYQASDEFMLHDDAVTCATVSRDSELLATGSSDGAVKVWAIRTGECVRRYVKPHGDAAVTVVVFSGDAGMLLTAGQDALLKLHGLRSGTTLREFRGHSAYVSAAMFTSTGGIVSASGDGTVRVWDAHSGECTSVLRPPQASAAVDASIATIALIPRSSDHVLVVPRAGTAYVMTLAGVVLRSLTHGKQGVDFLGATVSNHGRYAYMLATDGFMYTFSLSTGRLEVTGVDATLMHGKGAVGIAHHPMRNVLVTYGIDGTVQAWR